IAEIAPDEVVKLFRSFVKLERVERCSNFANRIVHLKQDLEVVRIVGTRRRVGGALHLDEPRRVPNLVHKVAATSQRFSSNKMSCPCGAMSIRPNRSPSAPYFAMR